jgi:hypothetical protein
MGSFLAQRSQYSSLFQRSLLFTLKLLLELVLRGGSSQRQETLDLPYLTLLCDNLKNTMFLQIFFSWPYFGNLLYCSSYPTHSTIPQPNNFIRDCRIRLLGQKRMFTAETSVDLWPLRPELMLNRGEIYRMVIEICKNLCTLCPLYRPDQGNIVGREYINLLQISITIRYISQRFNNRCHSKINVRVRWLWESRIYCDFSRRDNYT